MDDLEYFKKNGKIQSYTFIADSSKRDFVAYPSSSEYVIEFNAPFRKVVGIELLDASIPKTELPVTPTTNNFVYKTSNGSKTTVTVDPSIEYTPDSLIAALHAAVSADGLSVSLERGKAIFSASESFTLYASESGLARVLGFTQNLKSVTTTSPAFEYTPPGLVNCAGPTHIIIHCPELETLIQHDRNFESCNPGIGIVKFSPYGCPWNPEFRPLPVYLATTPMARLSSMTIQLRKNDGSLYDTGNLDHILVMRMHWLEIDPRSLRSSPVH